MAKKICISTTSFAEYDNSYLEQCRKKGFEIIFNPHGRKIREDELIILAQDAQGLIAGTESITEDVLLKLPNLKVISRCGTGLDNVDLNAARRLGIKVSNTPDAPTVAVAELTVGLMLSILRNICRMNNDTINGKWNKSMGNLLMGKKVGIIGFGRIGRKVSDILKPFGCEIAYADPFVDDSIFGLKLHTTEDLLRRSDIITIHVSDNKCIIGKKELAMMKKGSWLINTSRGGVVNEEALYDSLRAGHLAGAAIDVFEREPYDGVLRKLDNVILTPHVGSYAKEARIEMEKQAVENLLKGLGDLK